MHDTLSAWLTLREPADAAARSLPQTRAIAAVVGAREPTHVLDLACGTGANFRYLAPHLSGPQRWLLVDKDPVLLALVAPLVTSWAAAQGAVVVPRPGGSLVVHGNGLDCHVETRLCDLDELDRAGVFQGQHLVTASALLDLTSDRWLRALAVRCRDAGAAALFALTYDGWSSCSPPEPEDDRIRGLLNRHQLRDKGLGGPAAGPEAAAAAVRAFEEVGYHVDRAASRWTLEPPARELQRQLIEGWAGAATEEAPAEEATIARWLERRLAHVEADRSRILVGHLDVAAWPARGASDGTGGKGFEP